MRTGYFRGTDDRSWDERSISAGDESKPVDCGGLGDKTIMFLSDTAGTLTILVDPVGDGDFQEYGTASISADTPEAYNATGVFKLMKIKFSDAATVTAKFAMEE